MAFPKICCQWLIPLAALVHGKGTNWRWSHDWPWTGTSVPKTGVSPLKISFMHEQPSLSAVSRRRNIVYPLPTVTLTVAANIWGSLCHFFHALNFGTENSTALLPSTC